MLSRQRSKPASADFIAASTSPADETGAYAYASPVHGVDDRRRDTVGGVGIGPTDEVAEDR
ncbi:hypothetical protein GCM10020358_14350 [Amorphoplanes nipponensis]|uniref:hypothetical protein n=1 Tax=Actinoplanes nipponensis TaxID=135950 RepID=UPI0031F07D05